MMMQVLQAGGLPVLTDGIRRPDEDNLRGYYEYEAVKRTKRDPSWVTRARGMAVKMVYRLLRDLPSSEVYRVLLMRRELSEVYASQELMLKRNGEPVGVMNLAEFTQVFRQELDETARWLRGQRNISLLEVDYNATVADPGPPLKAVVDFLGGGLDVAAMRNVIEPGLYRQKR